MEKKLNKELIRVLCKSIIEKLEKANYRDDAKEVVNDILDPNYVAEVDPDEVPPKRAKIMNKSKKEKGVKKLKSFKEKQDKKKGRCWDGYEPVPGKVPYSEGSCKKK